MDLDQRDGKLRVHYGDRLVTLMREVRQLSALGFAVPAKIQQTASTASKFYRHGMILKQVKYNIVLIYDFNGSPIRRGPQPQYTCMHS